MKDILSFHVGGFGVATGIAYWQQLCYEHGIDFATGRVIPAQPPLGGTNDNASSRAVSINDDALYNIRSAFYEKSDGCYAPKSIFADLDLMSIEKLQRMPSCFDQRSFIGEQGDGTGSNAAASRYNPESTTVRDRCMHEARRIVEQCDDSMGFIYSHALGGGAGSGLTATIASHVQESYPSERLIAFALLPSAIPDQHPSEIVTQALNCVFAMNTLHYTQSATVCMDNAGLQSALASLDPGLVKGSAAGYSAENALVAKVMSAATSGCRFKGQPAMDFHKLDNNLVNTPQLHYCSAHYSRISIPQPDAQRSGLHTTRLVMGAFSNDTRLLSVTPSHPTLKGGDVVMTGALSFRHDAAVGLGALDVQAALAAALRDRTIDQQVSWHIPSPFTYGIVPESRRRRLNVDYPLSAECTSFVNHTSIRHHFQHLLTQFKLVDKKNSFTHHFYRVGLDSMELREAECSLVDVATYYGTLGERFSKPDGEDDAEAEEEE